MARETETDGTLAQYTLHRRRNQGVGGMCPYTISLWRQFPHKILNANGAIQRNGRLFAVSYCHVNTVFCSVGTRRAQGDVEPLNFRCARLVGACAHSYTAYRARALLRHLYARACSQLSLRLRARFNCAWAANPKAWN